MTRTSLLILFSFIALMCSNKKKVSINKFDEKLIEEVVNLVERPNVIMGKFNEK